MQRSVDDHVEVHDGVSVVLIFLVSCGVIGGEIRSAVVNTEKGCWWLA
jgi:hypothetical protein